MVLPVPVPYNLRRRFPYEQLGQQRMILLLYALFRRGLSSGWFDRSVNRISLSTNTGALGRLIFVLKGQEPTAALVLHMQSTPFSESDLARIMITYASQVLRRALPMSKEGPMKLYLALPGHAQVPFAMQQEYEPGVEEGPDELPESRLGRQLAADPRLPVWLAEFTDAADLFHDHERQRLVEILSQLEPEFVLTSRLDSWLAQHPDIKSLFFGVELITTEQVLRKMLGDFTVRRPGDEQIGALASQLTETPENRRYSLGLLHFFGYPREFLQSLGRELRWREMILKGAEFKAELDFAVLDFLHHKCDMVSRVMLEESGVRIAEPAKQALLPYMFSRMAIKYIKVRKSEMLREIASSGARRDFYEQADPDRIKADLIKRATLLASGNLSPGEGRDRIRDEALMQVALDQPDPAELGRSFDEDWEQLKPVIRKMERKLLNYLPRQPIVILDDFGSMDEGNRFVRILKALRLRLRPRRGRSS